MEKGKVILLGTLPVGEDMDRILSLACRYAGITYKRAEKNIMLARRKGTNREGIILAEYAGKGGVCHLDKADGRMTDILSGRDYQGDVFLKPYEVLVLEKSC